MNPLLVIWAGQFLSASNAFGQVFGVGEGSGMALMLALTGLVGLLVTVGGFAYRPIRAIEDQIPDHDLATASIEPL